MSVLKQSHLCQFCVTAYNLPKSHQLLESGIDVGPGINVTSPHKHFNIRILIDSYINQGIAVNFIFFLQNFSKMNNRTPTFIPDSRVGRKRFQLITAKFLHLQSSNFQVNHISLMINAISAMEGDLRQTEAET